MEATALSAVVTRAFESSPTIVVVMAIIGLFVWRAWREDGVKAESERARRDADWLGALREEREARLTQHRETMTVVASCTTAVQAVREALLDLRHAINDKTGTR